MYERTQKYPPLYDWVYYPNPKLHMLLDKELL